jgi:FtsX-like permease family
VANAWIMLRAKSDAALLAPTLRKRIQDLDPDLPVQEMQSMTSVMADSLWLKRLSASLIGLVAAMAILLAGAGIYSVMSYSVSQRRKEVGIRVAFGADRRDVLGLIMGETCRLAVLGSVLGCAGAFVVGRRNAHGIPFALAGLEPISGPLESGSVPTQFTLSLLCGDLRELYTGAPCVARGPDGGFAIAEARASEETDEGGSGAGHRSAVDQ